MPVFPTRTEATIFYLKCTTPTLQRWLKTWKHGLRDAHKAGTVTITERQWHLKEINRVIAAKRTLSSEQQHVKSRRLLQATPLSSLDGMAVRGTSHVVS